MSAVYGFVDFTKKSNTSKEIMYDLEKPFIKYKFDNSSQINEPYIGLSYLMQDITPESTYENQPMRSEKKVMVCDAIIDNRDELFDHLHVAKESRYSIADGALMMLCYEKWGFECCKRVYGDYVFIVYDSDLNQLTICRDHIGARSLYYSFNEGVVKFSTLMASLLSQDKDDTLDVAWLTFFLSKPAITSESNGSDTLYTSIKTIEPGTITHFNQDQVTVNRFWFPEKIKVNNRSNTNDNLKAFGQIYDNAVKAKVRSSAGLGIMLSGGLDSSSVACLASKYISDNEVLKAYTTVPKEGFNDWTPSHLVTNEKSWVEAIVDKYPNIQPTFIDSGSVSAYTVIDELIETLEMPYKFVENSHWITEIYKQANADGCKVLLNGAFGNMSISFGQWEQVVYQHIRKFRIKKTISEINAYARINRIGRKVIVKWLINSLIKQFTTLKHQKYANEIVKDELKLKFNIEKKLQGVGYRTKPFQNIHQQMIYGNHPAIYNHFANTFIKLDLAYGMRSRDATRDVRVIEACLSYPDVQFADLGISRKLIRDAMDGIVPSVILENVRFFGFQGADWLERLEPVWQDIINEVLESYKKSTEIGCVISSDYLTKLIDNNKTIRYDQLSSYEIRTVIWILIVLRFEKSYRKEGVKDETME